MNATKKKQEKEESDDDFQYEEVSLGEDWSLIEGEEDLEATVKAIQDRAEATSAAAAAAADTSITHQPEAVDDFLRNFLFHMCMTETLDCFQTEWTEMVQKGQVDAELVGVVPDVYTGTQRLHSELRNVQREGEEYSQAAAAGAETLERIRRDRDQHRLQHKRVIQEKNRLIEEMRKLKVHCDNYEPAVKRMNEKYQAVLKQTSMQVTLERPQNTTPLCGDEEEEEGAKGTTHPVIQPRPPPTSANSPRSQTRVKCFLK